MVSSAVAFSYSKWNADTQDREKVLFQSCETLEDEPLPEVWWLLLQIKKVCQKEITMHSSLVMKESASYDRIPQFYL